MCVMEGNDLFISKRKRIKIRRPYAKRYPLTHGAISRAHIFDPTSSLESGQVSQTPNPPFIAILQPDKFPTLNRARPFLFP